MKNQGLKPQTKWKSGSEIFGRFKISQAELDRWVNGEQGEGSGFGRGRWAAWAWGEACGLS